MGLRASTGTPAHTGTHAGTHTHKFQDCAASRVCAQLRWRRDRSICAFLALGWMEGSLNPCTHSYSLLVEKMGGPLVSPLPAHLHVRTFGIVKDSRDKRLGARSATVPGRGAREQRTQPERLRCTTRGEATRAGAHLRRARIPSL